MKKLIFIILLALNITPAYADEGGWVKVNAEGKVISGTSVCTPDVCGNVNSEYSKLTLAPGEHYVQITKADSTGNVVGPNVLSDDNSEGRFDAVANTVTFVRQNKILAGSEGLVTTQSQTTYSVGEGEIDSKTSIVSIDLPLTWLTIFQDMFFNFIWVWNL